MWGKDVYAQTGVLPYVHEKGARVPSLRRLYKKHPYFTNGSASSLDDVSPARASAERLPHDVASGVAKDARVWTAVRRDALLAFMRSL